MSPTFVVNTSAPYKIFRGVNGQRINLSVRSDADGNEKHQNRVIEFELRNECQPVNFRSDILILFAIVLLWNIVAHQLIIAAVIVLYTLLRCKSVLSFVRTDTLLVVESVGVQIIKKRVLSYFESTTFLPWNTVKDVFINEVITANRVLYFLTLIVRDTSCGKDEAKLVPLFRDLKPERKCLEYIKELMKVIRRIIKSQPRQGQQFGTQHLLVTYNHSSWTRQDKMFAILKFRDRTDANAFPRAFILTVKLLSTNSTSNDDDEYEDELIFYKKDANSSQWTDSEDPNTNVNGDDLSKEGEHIPTIATDETSSDSSTRLTPICSSTMRVGENVSLTGSTKRNDDTKKANSASLFADLDDLPLLERYFLEKRDQPNELQQPQHSSTHQEPLNEMQETVDMPYQYLIEREIERRKKHDTKNLSIQKKFPNESTNKSSEGFSAETSSPRNRGNSTNTIDNATARSADITDLVMEGLMFTIRQDKDTITVMEQKTKLEPDEVLENSEKVETKEGSKCLVNSSLLKLENLITKIERSSVVHSKPRFIEDYNNELLLSRFHTMDGFFRVNDQAFFNRPYDLKEKDHTITNRDIIECNISERNSFISPKAPGRPFKNRKRELNDFETSLNKLNENNVQSIHNRMVNNNNHHSNDSNINNNNNNNINQVGEGAEVINEPINEGKIYESLVGKQMKKQHIHTELVKCNNEKKSEHKKDVATSLDEIKTVSNYADEYTSTNECCKTNGVIDNQNLEKLPRTPGLSETGSKLKTPRIISSEIVKYDLSSLRSSRLRRRPNTNEDGNNSPKNENIDRKSFSNSNILIQKKSQLSNDEKKNDATMTNRRRLIAKRRLHGQKNDDDTRETTIEMWKFVQDMTQGVRVVLQRLDLSQISSGTGKKC